MKQDIKPKNNKNKAHGLWITYYSNDICYKGHYINDLENGYWIDNWSCRPYQVIFHLK